MWLDSIAVYVPLISRAADLHLTHVDPSLARALMNSQKLDQRCVYNFVEDCTGILLFSLLQGHSRCKSKPHTPRPASYRIVLYRVHACAVCIVCRVYRVPCVSCAVCIVCRANRCSPRCVRDYARRGEAYADMLKEVRRVSGVGGEGVNAPHSCSARAHHEAMQRDSGGSRVPVLGCTKERKVSERAGQVRARHSATTYERAGLHPVGARAVVVCV